MAKPNAVLASLLVLTTTSNLVHYSSAQDENIDPETKLQIDDFIQTVYLPESGTTSLALAIVENNGDVLYTTGYGYADQEKMIANGNETQFLIGSITKSLTATVIVKVLSEKYPDLGEAVLDVPVTKLLPEVNFTMIDRFRSEHVTFRDLLAHRVCTFTDELLLDADAVNTTTEFVYRQRYAEEICGIRTEFRYNNILYIVAGELIGVIANRPYEDLVRDFLDEIGIHNASFVKQTDDLPNMDYRAKPYYIADKIAYQANIELPKRLEKYNAGAGLAAHPNDMVKYMQFLLNRGKVGKEQIIPEEVMTWLSKPSIHMPAFSFKSTPSDKVFNTFAYGLGLDIGSYDGWQYIGHSGFVPPYFSLMSLYPSKNLGIFVTTNQGPVHAAQVDLHAFIFDTLSGVPNAKEKVVLRLKEKKYLMDEEDSKELNQSTAEMCERVSLATNQNELIGAYGSGSGGDIEIYEKFNDETNTTGLYLSYGKWLQAWLENDDNGDGLYKLIWDSDIVQVFAAAGGRTGQISASIADGILKLVMPLDGGGLYLLGTFQLGVSLGTLPPIPWNPGSCGPE